MNNRTGDPYTINELQRKLSAELIEYTDHIEFIIGLNKYERPKSEYNALINDILYDIRSITKNNYNVPIQKGVIDMTCLNWSMKCNVYLYVSNKNCFILTMPFSEKKSKCVYKSGEYSKIIQFLMKLYEWQKIQILKFKYQEKEIKNEQNN